MRPFTALQLMGVMVMTWRFDKKMLRDELAIIRDNVHEETIVVVLKPNYYIQ
jgi:hypothetical protein